MRHYLIKFLNLNINSMLCVIFNLLCSYSLSSPLDPHLYQQMTITVKVRRLVALGEGRFGLKDLFPKKKRKKEISLLRLSMVSWETHCTILSLIYLSHSFPRVNWFFHNALLKKNHRPLLKIPGSWDDG